MEGTGRYGRIAPMLAIAFVVILRALHPDQPIVENYVGRQVPTAMVARNLERGSGFLHPQLDTAPIPNYFLVEPPIYAQIVAGLREFSRFDLVPCGRWISALAMGLAAWGLYGLARRREGPAVALLAVLAFGLFPVTIRYGRAFQPDALMLGLLVAGMRLWDDHEAEGGAWRLGGAWLLIATGLAVKIVSAYVLVPLALGIFRVPRRGKILLACLALVPALIWYGYAASMLRYGSRASADNAAMWGRALGVSALLRPETWTLSARFLFVRSFTPLGFVLAARGLFGISGADRLWRVWLAATAAAFLAMAGKIHHEYYWMALAPMMAVGVGRSVTLSRRGEPSSSSPLVGEAGRSRPGEGAARPDGPPDAGARASVRAADPATSPVAPPPHPAAGAAGLSHEGRGGNRGGLVRGSVFVAFGMLGLYQSRTTWQTPPEWAALPRADIAVHRPFDRRANRPMTLIAPEAALFAADRRGFRLESEPAARVRAAGEFGATIDREDPLALIEFYRSLGAKFVVDLAAVGDEPHRRLLHEAIRRRYNVIVDRDGVILAELTDKSAR